MSVRVGNLRVLGPGGIRDVSDSAGAIVASGDDTERILSGNSRSSQSTTRSKHEHERSNPNPKKTQTRIRRTTITRNITIDDTLGDPTNNNHFVYSPDNLWQQGNGCSGCTIRPDPNLVSNETWHDTTWFPPSSGGTSPIHSASVQFNGTLRFSICTHTTDSALLTFYLFCLGSAVYVFCILSGSSPDGNTDMTFFIDDEQVGAFAQAPNGDPTLHYNSLVYSNADLNFGPHTFRLETGHLGKQAAVFLDYLMYT